METKKITCTSCPIGCQIEVKLDGNKIESVTGNSCKRGDEYARNETTNPKRTVTTTVCTDKGIMLSVKTENPIPKGLMEDAVSALSEITANTPIHIGDTVLADICSTGLNVVATKNII